MAEPEEMVGTMRASTRGFGADATPRAERNWSNPVLLVGAAATFDAISIRWSVGAVHPLMRLVLVDGCEHRVSLSDGQPFMRSGRPLSRHPAPAINFVQFAKHEHFIFCLNGPFLSEPEQAAIKERLFASPETGEEAV